MTREGEQPAVHRAPLAADAPLRVVLVGRTGLDAALRLDTAIELIRSRTALEALGELADPIDTESPSHAAVVIGDDVELGRYARDFVDGLRLIDPEVRVYSVGAPHDAELDGVIDPRDAADTIRRAVRGLAAEPGKRPAPGENGRTPGRSPARPGLVDALADELREPAARGTDQGEVRHRQQGASAGEAAPDTPTAAPATADADDSPASASDERSVLDAMLTGGDVLEAALDVVRSKLGAHDVVFVPGDVDALVGAPVTYRGRTLGVLRSVHAARDELARYADWLARWVVLRDQHNQLRIAAMTDELTSAYNRRYFTRFLAAAMDQARRSRTSVTLLAFDIDDFKVYNDRYGHAAGDEILREIVRLLKSVIRPTDRVCRVGGDEFVVIFYGPEGPRQPDSRPPTSVFEIAKRFQRQICEHHFPKLLEEAPGTLTISGGLATYPWDGRTAEELLERADELALESKRQGKNAITLGPGAQRVCGMWD